MKKEHKRCLKRIVAAALVMLMMSGTVPFQPIAEVFDTAIVASAESDFAKTATNTTLGTSHIPAPTYSAENTSWTGSFVYYGKFDGTPMKYRVLDPTVMFLDCDTTLITKRERDEAVTWMNGDGFIDNTDVFTDAENNAISGSEGNRIFLLNVDQLNNPEYGYKYASSNAEKTLADNSRKKTGVTSYWFCSLDARRITDDGSIVGKSMLAQDEILDFGVSPAFNVDPPSVLFSSRTSDNTYKLTLTDTSMTVALNGDITKSGSTVTVPYTISENAEKVSVLITDKEWNAADAQILQYEQLSGTGGTGTFTLASGLPETYNVYLIAEDINGDQYTDYASVPFKIELPSVTYTHHDAVAPTCTVDGTIEYWEGSDGKNYEDENGVTELDSIVDPATGHNWGEPTYTWSNDYSTVTATRTCRNDKSHVETETVNTTSAITKAATCTAKGETTYTATFTNAAFATQTKTIANIDETGHTYGEPTWTWNGTESATASFTCTQDDNTQTVDATITSEVTTEPTCEDEGVRTYTATVKFGDVEYTNTKTASEPAKGHDWGEWEVTTPATATTDGVETRTCKHDASHTETRAIEKTAIASGKCGDDIVWVLDKDGVLTLTGTGAMYDYTVSDGNNPAPWKDVRDQIKSIVIEEGITSVGQSAFISCENVESVKLPDTLTKIGVDSFNKCRSLTSITIPKNVTDIRGFAFSCCDKLETVYLCAPYDKLNWSINSPTEKSLYYFMNGKTTTVYVHSNPEAYSKKFNEGTGNNYINSSDKVSETNKGFNSRNAYYGISGKKDSVNFVEVDSICTDNGDGTHTHKCSACGEVISTENHIYQRYVCECGNDQTFTVKTEINGTSSTKTITAKNSFTVKAPEVDGKTFSYWEVNGVKGSTSATYSFIVLDDLEVKAVYDDDEPEEKAVLTIKASQTKSNNKNAVRILFNRSIPSDCTVEDVGLLYGTNKLLGADTNVSDYAKVNLTTDNTLGVTDVETALKTKNTVKKFVGGSKLNDGTLDLAYAVGTNTDCYVYAMGYVTIINSSGEEETLYTDVIATTFNSAN